jgi:hypothetical protein
MSRWLADKMTSVLTRRVITCVADVVFQYGDPNDLHLAGRWAAGSPAEGPGSAR